MGPPGPRLGPGPGLLLPLLLAAACSGGEEPAAGPPPPNLLLVVVDTLRQDHLQPYGYTEHPTSPVLAELARESVLVDGLTCVSTWTMPSMATLFTGLSPAAHGVMRLVGPDSRLREPRTLAAEFARAGYVTGGVMANFLLTRRRGVGFDRGFASWDDAPGDRPDPHRGSTADEVAERGLAWLARQSPERPWFLLLHFFDPHASYEDHPDLDFADPDYQGWVAGGLANDVYRQHQASCSAADRAQLAAYYDEEIRAVDRALGRVLAVLRTRPDWQRTLVVLTSDHGEELGERGRIGHTFTLHREITDLPLLVRLPGSAGGGRVLRQRLSQLGLYATLLELCGLPVPPGRGASFADLLRGAAPGPPEPVPLEVDYVPIRTSHRDKFVRKRGVLAPPWKLVLDLDAGTMRLWNLEEDPEELRDRAGDPEVAPVRHRLRAWVDAWNWWEEP